MSFFWFVKNLVKHCKNKNTTLEKKATFYNVNDEYFDSLLNPLEEDIKQTKNIIQTKQGILV